jgi:hypothetical protein
MKRLKVKAKRKKGRTGMRDITQKEDYGKKLRRRSCGKTRDRWSLDVRQPT